ncbi:hypothetical protein [Streptomyces sp. NPDC048442]|uniref:hypothetical protein n=1 Tax=Streptomyces sp. NPDC048442 TaxID=3154823 RepID=UPI00341518B8
MTEFRNGGCTVTFTHHYVFPAPEEQRQDQQSASAPPPAPLPREELLSSATLRFRTETEIRDSLHAAGFTVEQMYGGWRREGVGAGDGEFIVVATAAATTATPESPPPAFAPVGG